MEEMFYGASSFNQDISGWNLSTVSKAGSMFKGAESFNQNLCSWADNFPYRKAHNIFAGSGCSYDDTPKLDHHGPFCASKCDTTTTTTYAPSVTKEGTAHPPPTYPPSVQSNTITDTDKPHTLFGIKAKTMIAETYDDMKHECSSTSCRSIAALLILGTVAIVIAGIRQAMARRHLMRQYQETELEITDLALDPEDENNIDETGSDEDEGEIFTIT